MFPNIHGKVITAALNLYVSVLKRIDCTLFEINQYVIKAVTSIIYELEKLLKESIVSSFVFYLVKVRTYKKNSSVMLTMYNIQLAENFWKDPECTISIPMFWTCQKLQCVLRCINKNYLFISNTAIIQQKGIAICCGAIRLWQIKNVFYVNWSRWYVCLDENGRYFCKVSLAMAGLL